MKKITKYSILILTIWFLSHIIYTTIDGLKQNQLNADLAVILGNKVNTDGTLSKRLEKRLECGLNLYNNNKVKKILVSGGLGKEGYYEGTKMKEYLLKNGVPKSDILTDNYGDNTLKTVENTLKLKKKMNFKKIIIVSQFYHITRTKMLFKKRGIANLSSASPKYFEFRDIYSLAREFVAYYAQH